MLELFMNAILECRILKKEMFDGHDTNDLLDLRDIEEYRNERIRVNALVDKLMEENRENFIEEELSYVQGVYRIMRFTEGALESATVDMLSEAGVYYEIALDIGEDCALIAKAYLLNINDPWLNSLILSYANNEFPCGEIEKTSVSFTEALNQLLK
ncbi:MAG: hypothetical protein R3Y54_10570 [Eubacteriales bacterium]